VIPCTGIPTQESLGNHLFTLEALLNGIQSTAAFGIPQVPIAVEISYGNHYARTRPVRTMGKLPRRFNAPKPRRI
jgi:hypothetical protein